VTRLAFGTGTMSGQAQRNFEQLPRVVGLRSGYRADGRVAGAGPCTQTLPIAQSKLA
jgi:hypothetical protein